MRFVPHGWRARTAGFLILWYAVLMGSVSGSAHGQSLCHLVIRNETAHTVDIYVDGTKLFDVEPHGNRFVDVAGGAAKLYARATCHAIEWGPEVQQLGEQYVWRLTP